MAIDIRPQNPNLESMFQAARPLQTGGTISDILGVANNAVSAAQNRQKQALLAQMLASKEIPAGYQPSSPEEALGLAKIREAMNAPTQQDILSRKEAADEEKERRRDERQEKSLKAAEDRFNKSQEAIEKRSIRSLEESRERYEDKKSQLGAKASEAYANLSSGIDSIGEMRRILNSGAGKRAKLKAGSMGSSIWSIGDTEAQKLAKAAGEAADVLTRARTGAALNKDEQTYYGRLFINSLDTAESTEAGMQRYEKLFKDTQDLMKGGRNIGESKTAFLTRLEGEFGKSNGSGQSAPVGGGSDAASKARAILERRKAGK